MLNSMTGFGRACVERDGREMTVELKAVNHRYLDLGFRMPRAVSFLEDVFRGALNSRFSRGHVDVFVNYRNNRKDARAVSVDAALLKAYLDAARQAALGLELEDDLMLSDVLRLPEVLSVSETEEDQQALIELARVAVQTASDELGAMREREGENLRRDLGARLETLMGLAQKIGVRAPGVVAEYQKKLNQRVQELLGGAAALDPARLAMEVAIFADKASIDEELVRINSHVGQFNAILDAAEPAGRKLDFVVQELNREFNTIGSKANDADILNWVIAGKAEIEKIREQVQNIE